MRIEIFQPQQYPYSERASAWSSIGALIKSLNIFGMLGIGACIYYPLKLLITNYIVLDITIIILSIAADIGLIRFCAAQEYKAALCDLFEAKNGRKPNKDEIERLKHLEDQTQRIKKDGEVLKL